MRRGVLFRRGAGPVVCGLLGLACAAPVAPTPAAAPPSAQAAATASSTTTALALAPPAPTTLKGTDFGLPADAITYLGQERGYFAEQGIELDLARVEPIQIPTLLAAGQVDWGIVSVSAQLFQALGRGLDVHLVAETWRNTPNYSSNFLSVRTDLLDSGRVRDYADLRGLTIALSGLGGGTTYYLGRGLERGGLSRDDVNLVTVSYGDMAAAFANQALDAAMLTEPFGTVTQRQGTARRWKLAGELAGDVPGQLLQFSPAMYREKRAAGERFAVGYTRAARDYYDAFVSGRGDRAAAVDVLVRRTAIKDPALYDEMMLPTVDPNPYVDLAGVVAQQEWFFAQGLTPELRAPVDLARITDRGFVDHALAVLGPYQ